MLRPGAWNWRSPGGTLHCRSSRRVALYRPLAVGTIVFRHSPGQANLSPDGLYSKIRNPIYVFSGLLVLGILIALQYRYALLLLLVLIPVQIVRARQEAKRPRSQVRRPVPEIPGGNLVLAGCIISSSAKGKSRGVNMGKFVSVPVILALALSGISSVAGSSAAQAQVVPGARRESQGSGCGLARPEVRAGGRCPAAGNRSLRRVVEVAGRQEVQGQRQDRGQDCDRSIGARSDRGPAKHENRRPRDRGQGPQQGFSRFAAGNHF